MASRAGIRNYRFSFNFFLTPAVQWLIVANAAVYIFEILLRTFSGQSAYNWFVGHFGLVPSAVVPGLRIWQPFTYLFLHDASTIWHILSNMFFLYMFGRELELAWGRNRFLQYYFLTGVGAGIINVIVKISLFWGRPSADISTIGASAAIFVVLLPCPLRFPALQLVMFPIPVKMSMRTFVIAMTALEFISTFGFVPATLPHT